MQHLQYHTLLLLIFLNQYRIISNIYIVLPLNLIYIYSKKLMENITNLQKLIDKATSNSENYPQDLNEQILALLNSRVDMPKHTIAAISKRMILKNKNVLINVFTLLEFLAYNCELSLFTQISTKEFLFKISGLLMNKDIDPAVKDKIMQTVYCWEQLFRPHEDLLPLFFTFYAGLLRNNFEVPHGYKSQYRPAKLKQYKKIQSQSHQTGSKRKQPKYVPQPTLTEQQTFQEIRQKLILTNEIIDNASPSDSVKDNALLIEMIDQIKECEKKVNKTIDANPNQKIMELALAANDDIFITYRRFKDLQRNKKPEPFILTELASDIIRQQTIKVEKKQQMKKPEQKKVESPEKKERANILDFLDEEPKKEEQPKPKEQNILDLDFQPVTKPENLKPAQNNVFDLLGDAQLSPKKQSPKKNPNGYDELFASISVNNQPPVYNANNQNSQQLYNLNLNDDFNADADKKQKDNSAMDQLGDLSDFLKK